MAADNRQREQDALASCIFDTFRNRSRCLRGLVLRLTALVAVDDIGHRRQAKVTFAVRGRRRGGAVPRLWLGYDSPPGRAAFDAVFHLRLQRWRRQPLLRVWEHPLQLPTLGRVRRWRCGGRTGSATGSPTSSCRSTCGYDTSQPCPRPRRWPVPAGPCYPTPTPL